eukprot:996887-Rhodomonas_salina.2
MAGTGTAPPWLSPRPKPVRSANGPDPAPGRRHGACGSDCHGRWALAARRMYLSWTRVPGGPRRKVVKLTQSRQRSSPTRQRTGSPPAIARPCN